MAVCIMFGLSFAAIWSLLVTPVFYAIFFRIDQAPLISNSNLRSAR
jgi:hypothetical protein